MGVIAKTTRWSRKPLTRLSELDVSKTNVTLRTNILLHPTSRGRQNGHRKSALLAHSRRRAQQAYTTKPRKHPQQRRRVFQPSPHCINVVYCPPKLTCNRLAVLSLADKQKALEHFADTAEAQKFVSQAPIPNQQQQLTQPQIQYIQAAPTPQAQQARKAKILRNPVVWQVTEQQLKELQWKRKQLLQAQKAELERKKAARAKRPPAPKLGPSKNASRAGSVVASSNKAPQAKVPHPEAPQAKSAPPKPSQANAAQKAPAKPAAKPPQTEKAPAKK